MKALKRAYMWITSQICFKFRVDFRIKCFMTKTNRNRSGENQNTVVFYFETLSVFPQGRRLGHILRH